MRGSTQNLGGLSHLGCAWGRHERGNHVARGGVGLESIMYDTSRTAGVVAVHRSCVRAYPTRVVSTV